MFAVRFIAKLAENFLRGGGAEVGADERGLEIIERVAIDFLAEGDDFFNALGEIFARARDRLLHALEKAGLLFFGAAK